MELLIMVLAFLLNIPIGLVSMRKKSLSFPGGLLGAAIVGVITFLAHPYIWMTLLTFFITSTAIGKYKGSEKAVAMEYAEKGGERDFFQVMANGGVATAASVIILINFGIYNVGVTEIWVVIAVTSIAASAADTWATEVGTTTTNDPIWIFPPWNNVPKGTSGGVTFKGFMGTAMGAAVIGALYFFLTFSTLALYIVLGGILGSLIDTLLGASIQSVYYCETCKKQTEKKYHKCGTESKHIRGWRIMDNDVVNLLSGIIASSIIYWIIG